MIQQIGKHKVRHGDVHAEAEIAQLMNGVTADIFYSDPPWGEGNLKYWQTMNRKMNSDAVDPINTKLDKFLDTVLGYAVKYTRGFVVIEYGLQWTDQVIAEAEKKGLIHCGTVETLYGSQNLPLNVIVFHTNKQVNIDLSSVYHTKGYTTVKTMFALLKQASGKQDTIGADLCCGMGYTAQACIDNGMTFYGNELNKARLAKTIKRLQKG